MSRKNSKNRTRKPIPKYSRNDLAKLAMPDSIQPIATTSISPEPQIQADSISAALEKVLASGKSELPKDSISSFSDGPSPVQDSSDSDAEIEVTHEELGDLADDFENEMSVEEMLNGVFEEIMKVEPGISPRVNPFQSTVFEHGFDVDLTELEKKTTSLPPSVHSAPTIAPPAFDIDEIEDPNSRATGDYTFESEMLWAFLNSPAADQFHQAQEKFEQTKDIADKPDLDSMVMAFHFRKKQGIKP